MTELDIDTLAQEIRRVDGNHSLGAGALAEALLPFIKRAVLGSAEPFAWAVGGLDVYKDHAVALANVRNQSLKPEPLYKVAPPAPVSAEPVNSSDELILVADRQLTMAYQAGLNGDDFDMLSAKIQIEEAASNFNTLEIAAKIVDDEADNAREEHYYPGVVGILESAAAAIRALASAPPSTNAKASEIEKAAQAIYDGWRSKNGYVEWVPNGNSLKQDEARQFARQAIATSAPPSTDAKDADRVVIKRSSHGSTWGGLFTTDPKEGEDAARWRKLCALLDAAAEENGEFPSAVHEAFQMGADATCSAIDAAIDAAIAAKDEGK